MVHANSFLGVACQALKSIFVVCTSARREMPLAKPRGGVYAHVLVSLQKPQANQK